jgi:hypothetical protein
MVIEASQFCLQSHPGAPHQQRSTGGFKGNSRKYNLHATVVPDR